MALDGSLLTGASVPTAAQGSGSSSSSGSAGSGLAPDPRGYFANLFQQKTGLSPLAFWLDERRFQDVNRPTTGSTGQGFLVSGTGAAATYTALGGGCIAMQGTTAGAGFCDWAQSPSGATATILNGRQKRWMTNYLVAIGHAPAAASRVAWGAFIGTQMIGLGYGAADTTWHYCRAVNNVVDLIDTGRPIDSGGLNFIWLSVFNDGDNVNYCVDVLGTGPVFTVAETAANIPTATGFGYGFNEGTGASDLINFRTAIICCEQ